MNVYNWDWLVQTQMKQIRFVMSKLKKKNLIIILVNSE